MVNLASRLEGLTKVYHEPIIISESVQRKISAIYPCRLLNRVVVKGKSAPVKIYNVKNSLDAQQKLIWQQHEKAMELYIARDFEGAVNGFQEILDTKANDALAKLYIRRCREYLENPPPDSWQGEFVLRSK